MDEEITGHDELWDLLDRVPRKGASPWFADRVMRGVEETKPAEAIAGWVRSALPVGCGLVIVLLACVVGIDEGSDVGRHATAELIVGFEFISDLDLIVASSDSSLWLDNIATSSF